MEFAVEVEHAYISIRLEVGSNSNFSILISKKLGLEAGLRVIWTGSGSFGLETLSSSSARARKFWARSTSSLPADKR